MTTSTSHRRPATSTSANTVAGGAGTQPSSSTGARRNHFLAGNGALVVVPDLPSSRGAEVATAVDNGAVSVAGDVTGPKYFADAVRVAQGIGPLCALFRCAGVGNAVRVVGKDGRGPRRLRTIIKVNPIGSINVLRTAAAVMAGNEPDAAVERGSAS